MAALFDGPLTETLRISVALLLKSEYRAFYKTKYTTKKTDFNKKAFISTIFMKI